MPGTAAAWRRFLLEISGFCALSSYHAALLRVIEVSSPETTSASAGRRKGAAARAHP
jgi:hypothetical protein